MYADGSSGPSYSEIAASWPLWCEFVNPSGAMSEAEFGAMTTEERIAFVVACFGDETATEASL